MQPDDMHSEAWQRTARSYFDEAWPGSQSLDLWPLPVSMTLSHTGCFQAYRRLQVHALATSFAAGFWSVRPLQLGPKKSDQASG